MALLMMKGTVSVLSLVFVLVRMHLRNIENLSNEDFAAQSMDLFLTHNNKLI